MTNKTFEEKILLMILADTRIIFKDENTVAEKYYDAWCYVNELIDIVADNASEWLLTELYTQREYYQDKYLKIKKRKMEC